MSLVNELIKGLLPEEEKKQTTAVYAGGFKPPTSGHFEVVQQALKENPEIDEFIIFVGAKPRDGVSQTESLLIWEIYNNYLPFKVKIEPSSLPPIRAVYDFAKNHPTREVLWVIGAREGNEEDFKDITSRTSSISKYPNLELRTIITSGGVSGTAARNAAKVSLDKFEKFVPDQLTDEEKEEVYSLVSGTVQELNENATYSQHIDVMEKVTQLTNHMIDKGMNIEPLPTMEFIDGDTENAENFFGKTAYYDPNNQHIVVYTEGRHPKDILRSYAHEMIHHIQYLEDRLHNITTTNTNEDEDLDAIEKEAYVRGNMTFRNWTDSLTGNLNENLDNGEVELVQQFKKEVGAKQCSLYGKRDNCGPAALDFISWAESKGIKGLKRIDGYFKADIPISSKRDFTREMKQEFLNDGGNWDSAKERFDWINSSKYAKQWKYIPHYWVEDINGKIYDPSGQQQFIDAGYAKDLNSDRYTLSDVVENNHDNTSINEGKKKDPFGLLAYAQELGRLREDEGEYKVYLDMDGVLADFDQRFRDISGMEPKEFENKYGTKAFWNLIDEENKVKFWVGIPPMPGAADLVNAVKDYNYELLTSPSAKKQSYLGKILWVKNHTGDVFPSKPRINFKKAKEKHLIKPQLAKTDILIDDREDTIGRWNAAGGTGIIYKNISQVLNDLGKLGL